MDMSILTPDKQMKLQHWLDVIRQCRASGLTNQAWCEQHDISLKSYYYWIAKLRKPALEELPRKSHGCRPVMEQAALMPDAAPEFMEVSLRGRPESCASPNAHEPDLAAVEQHLRKRKYAGQREKLIKDIPRSKVLHTIDESEQICERCGSHKNSDFINLLKKLDGKYPEGDVIRIICDNHSAYKSREPVVYHWTYKMDEISRDEAVKVGVKSNAD